MDLGKKLKTDPRSVLPSLHGSTLQGRNSSFTCAAGGINLKTKPLKRGGKKNLLSDGRDKRHERHVEHGSLLEENYSLNTQRSGGGFVAAI